MVDFFSKSDERGPFAQLKCSTGPQILKNSIFDLGGHLEFNKIKLTHFHRLILRSPMCTPYFVQIGWIESIGKAKMSFLGPKLVKIQILTHGGHLENLEKIKNSLKGWFLWSISISMLIFVQIRLLYLRKLNWTLVLANCIYSNLCTLLFTKTP